MKDPQKVKDVLTKVSTELARVAETMDVNGFANALHDEWFSIDPSGKVSTKKERVEELRNQQFKPSSVKVHDLEVRIHGDTAVVTGISSVKAKHKGQDISGDYRISQTYKRKDGAQLTGTESEQDFAMVSCTATGM